MSWLLAWLAVLNLGTAGLYAYDKVAAPHGWRRIRERTLHICCWLGGVVGAWAVFFGMRHKTRHQSFWIVQTLASVLWAGVLLVAMTR